MTKPRYASIPLDFLQKLHDDGFLMVVKTYINKRIPLQRNISNRWFEPHSIFYSFSGIF